MLRLLRLDGIRSRGMFRDPAVWNVCVGGVFFGYSVKLSFFFFFCLSRV